ncbi:MAG: thioredoxin domain-containing protein [Candidatus Pacebacteria bacterium]|nr:thioredoxin domain-containing protein [Candidatus Paceibacterota bacterium]
MDDNKYIVPLAIIIAGALIGWGFYSNNNPNSTPDDPTNNPNQEIPTETPIEVSFKATDHILGDPNAKIKIITFSDFECPYCKTFHDTMVGITDKYAKDGIVAWTFRQFPVHGAPTEIKAAASECAGSLGGESKFWEMTEKIFETTSTSWITVEELPTIAIELGLNEEEFNACLENEEIEKKVQDDFQNGVDLGVTGTPTSIVFLESGEVFPINGAQPYDAVEGMINMILTDQNSL